MTNPLLSAAIIVKDEADFLRNCLTSIESICDELIVVDTGSRDDSVHVAESFGAIVATHPWQGDFAAARNRSLDLATGQWILYIDADEQLDPVDPALVRRELEEADDAVSLLVRFRMRPAFSPYREYRVWRHRDDIRFRNRIHETMVPDIERVAASGLAIRPSEHLSLTHFGYEGDQQRKHRRNLPLLEAQVVDDPTRCYLWNHLGDVRAALGDGRGALEAWGRGIALIRANGLVDRTDVLCYAGYCLHLIDQGHDVAPLINEIQALAPWYRTIDWLAACNHQTQGRHHDAIPHLRTLVATPADPVDDSLAYNNAMFTDWAWAGLAESLASIGNLAEAAQVWSQAAVARPDNDYYRHQAGQALASLAGTNAAADEQ